MADHCPTCKLHKQIRKTLQNLDSKSIKIRRFGSVSSSKKKHGIFITNCEYAFSYSFFLSRLRSSTKIFLKGTDHGQNQT